MLPSSKKVQYTSCTILVSRMVTPNVKRMWRKAWTGNAIFKLAAVPRPGLFGTCSFVYKGHTNIYAKTSLFGLFLTLKLICLVYLRDLQLNNLNNFLRYSVIAGTPEKTTAEGFPPASNRNTNPFGSRVLQWVPWSPRWLPGVSWETPFMVNHIGSWSFRGFQLIY